MKPAVRPTRLQPAVRPRQPAATHLKTAHQGKKTPITISHHHDKYILPSDILDVNFLKLDVTFLKLDVKLDVKFLKLEVKFLKLDVKFNKLGVKFVKLDLKFVKFFCTARYPA